MIRPPLLLAAALLLAACGDSGNQPGVGGVTQDEAAALNNAAEVLDASPDGLAAPAGEELTNEGAVVDNAG